VSSVWVGLELRRLRFFCHIFAGNYIDVRAKRLRPPLSGMKTSFIIHHLHRQAREAQCADNRDQPIREFMSGLLRT
jgi:hypothetical protein